MSERRLGTIVRLQIQRAALKTGGAGYDPSPLLEVEEAAIGPLGITGVAGGGHVVDVHHGAHPAGRGGGRRALSIGFTGHYALMGERFGVVPIGIGGENLIVEHPGRRVEEDLAGTIVIHGPDGEVALQGARVAAPCREFTSFLLGRDDVAPREEIAAELEFLGGGMRGFILDTSGLARPLPVRPGDEVVVVA